MYEYLSSRPLTNPKKEHCYVGSRHNTRAGVMALGQLLGMLLTILRRTGPASLPEISFDPGSPVR
jgi:hypothetical protein